jgi:phospholipid/cholesterol/gamma-HCH transport system permease protein
MVRRLEMSPKMGRQAALQGITSWFHIVYFGAVMMVMALSPSTYNRANRAITSRYIYASTWQVLPWFTAMAALLSLVLIRIVIVTALSYGLSQYALEMVVRVLVLELIPLSAALFVALRAGLAFNAGATEHTEHPIAQRADWIHAERLRHTLLPQVMAIAFSVLALAMISSVIVLILAYLTVYGLSPWGLPGYMRTVGHIFDVPVTLGFGLKTTFFSFAVAIVPMAASLEAVRHGGSASTVQPGAVRLFLVLLLLEAASLLIKYI